MSRSPQPFAAGSGIVPEKSMIAGMYRISGTGGARPARGCNLTGFQPPNQRARIDPR